MIVPRFRSIAPPSPSVEGVSQVLWACGVVGREKVVDKVHRAPWQGGVFLHQV